MIQKIEGARRILYKDDEIYVMTAGDAKRIFPNLTDVYDYTDNTLVFINGISENMHGVCASSDDFDDDELKLFASYDGNVPQLWENFHFTPILVAASCSIYMYSGISEDDHLMLSKDVSIGGARFLEYAAVHIAASKYFHTRAAISLLINGISDYSELVNGSYQKTRTVTEWGNGEEGVSDLATTAVPVGRTPVCIGMYHKDFSFLHRAASSFVWRNVPYIKLFIESGELPV